MLKAIITAIVLLVAMAALVGMYHGSENAAVAVAAERVTEAHVAATRPADIQHLKRAAVRAACTKHVKWDIDTCRLVDAKHVAIGMSDVAVTLSWGKPERINSTVTLEGTTSQWVYGDEYLYFTGGYLAAMHTSRVSK